MSNRELAENIVKLVGGPENVASLTHCVTRLRFVLRDKSKADMKAVGDLDGVLKTLEAGGQTQVVIGPHVKDVFE